jgi:hypothetical protein
MYDVLCLSSTIQDIIWAVDVFMHSDMCYNQWHPLAKMIYGINKYMNEGLNE